MKKLFSALLIFAAGCGQFGGPFMDRGGGGGGAATVAKSTQTLTFASGAGDASKATTSLVPDGAWLISVTTRTLVTGTGCTGVDYGDGTDQDLFGAGVALTAGTTTTTADATATFANPLFTGGADVTITALTANCVDLSVKVIAYYFTVPAPTS
jgi:hypothetical protein